MAQVIVTVSDQGDVQVEAKGVKGSGCKALTKAIEDSLGRVTADTPTAEMFGQTAQAAQVKS